MQEHGRKKRAVGSVVPVTGLFSWTSHVSSSVSAVQDRVQAKYFVRPLPDRFVVQYRHYRNVGSTVVDENDRSLHSLYIPNHSPDVFWLAGSSWAAESENILQLSHDLHTMDWKLRGTIVVDGLAFQMSEQYLVRIGSFQQGSFTKVLLEVTDMTGVCHESRPLKSVYEELEQYAKKHFLPPTTTFQQVLELSNPNMKIPLLNTARQYIAILSGKL